MSAEHGAQTSVRTTVQWLGQGGFLLSCGGMRLAIDPYLSDALYARKQGDDGFRRMVPPPIAPGALCADALLATHDHMDHLDEETVKASSPRIGLYIGPDSCARKYAALGVPERKICVLNRGDRMTLGGMALEAVYACHTEDSIGLSVRVPEGLCHFVGDSLLDERMLALPLRPDWFFCCINGRLGNMTAREAAMLAQRLEARVASPCHYGLLRANTEDPLRFSDALRGSPVRCVILDMGRVYGMETMTGGGSDA